MKLLFIVLIIILPVAWGAGTAQRLQQHTVTTLPACLAGMIDEAQGLLHEGDLVVRMNKDPLSACIRFFNRRDKAFSHSGIVLYENGYPYIFHMINGDENPGQKLRMDSLSHFCNPRKNTAFGIYRYHLNPGEIIELKKIIHQWYQAGVRFDSTFNLQTDDRMYCSEMVSKAITNATHKRISIPATPLSFFEASLFSTHTHLPLDYTSHLSIVAIDDLYSNPFCHLVKKYQYTKK